MTDYTPWKTKIQSKMGTVGTLPDGSMNPFLKECFDHTDYHPTSREPWCAAGLCWALETSGLASSHNASAISFANYGIPCGYIQGAIIVIEHAEGSHHVTTLDHVVGMKNGNPNLIACLGCNQSDSVKLSVYELGPGKDNILAVRWPVDEKGEPAPFPPTSAVRTQPTARTGVKDTIEIGSSGDLVTDLQGMLHALDILSSDGIDGQFGPNTKTAVEIFQEQHNLDVDGIVGPVTWGALSGAIHQGGIQIGPQDPIPGLVDYLDLPWSKNHPERSAWSTYIYAHVLSQWDKFSKVTDMEIFRSDWASLTKKQQITIWGVLICWTSYYECGWNATSSSVDVGVESDPNTYSVGLLQMSVVDQPNYGFNFGFTYEDLKDPIKNLQLGLAILGKQIDEKGKIVLQTSVYWSTLRDPNIGRYSEVNNIAAHVKAFQM